MSYFRATKDGVLVWLRVTPNAAHTRVDGVEQRDDGQHVLKIRVTAVPDKSKANKAVIALLAKTLQIAKSDIELVAGHTARQKKLLIRVDDIHADHIMAQLKSWQK